MVFARSQDVPIVALGLVEPASLAKGVGKTKVHRLVAGMISDDALQHRQVQPTIPSLNGHERRAFQQPASDAIPLEGCRKGGGKARIRRQLRKRAVEVQQIAVLPPKDSGFAECREAGRFDEAERHYWHVLAARERHQGDRQ